MKKIFSLAFILFSVTLFAQKGNLKGFILDKASGEAIAYATVKVDSTDFGASTDDQGFFNIPNLTVGSYKVSVTYIGYETQTQSIEITKGKTVNLKLLLAQVVWRMRLLRIRRPCSINWARNPSTIM